MRSQITAHSRSLLANWLTVRAFCSTVMVASMGRGAIAINVFVHWGLLMRSRHDKRRDPSHLPRLESPEAVAVDNPSSPWLHRAAASSCHRTRFRIELWFSGPDCLRRPKWERVRGQTCMASSLAVFAYLIRLSTELARSGTVRSQTDPGMEFDASTRSHAWLSDAIRSKASECRIQLGKASSTSRSHPSIASVSAF